LNIDVFISNKLLSPVKLEFDAEAEFSSNRKDDKFRVAFKGGIFFNLALFLLLLLKPKSESNIRGLASLEVSLDLSNLELRRRPKSAGDIHGLDS
jgi:hypothetical protein